MTKKLYQKANADSEHLSYRTFILEVLKGKIKAKKLVASRDQNNKLDIEYDDEIEPGQGQQNQGPGKKIK